MYGKDYNHADIKWRIRNSAAISKQELANLIAKDHSARMVWMVQNNPANVNDTLRHQHGHENLSFAPDEKQILGLIQLLDKNGDETSIQDIINKFVFDSAKNNWTAEPAFIEYLKLEGVIK
jgi:hypothetical protein